METTHTTNTTKYQGAKVAIIDLTDEFSVAGFALPACAEAAYAAAAENLGIDLILNVGGDKADDHTKGQDPELTRHAYEALTDETHRAATGNMQILVSDVIDAINDQLTKDDDGDYDEDEVRELIAALGVDPSTAADLAWDAA